MNSEKYVSSNYIQRCSILPIIEEFADEFMKMSGKCMDVGCGPGDVTENILLPILNPRAILTGTDILECMIQYAKRKYKDNRRLEFEVLDIQTKNLPEKYISEFDHVLSFHSLHWCHNIRQAFENIYQMLQFGGSMLILMVGSHAIFDVLKIVSSDIRYASYIPDIEKLISPLHDSIHPREELKNLLEDIGFEICHCSYRERTHIIKSTYDFASSLMSFLDLNGMTPDLVEDFKKTFINEYVKKLVRKQLQQNQIILLDLHNIFVVYARKPDKIFKKL